MSVDYFLEIALDADRSRLISLKQFFRFDDQSESISISNKRPVVFLVDPIFPVHLEKWKNFSDGCLVYALIVINIPYFKILGLVVEVMR